MNRAAFLALAFACTLLACSGTSSSSRTAPSFAGRWTLRTVNGTSLPFTTTQSATTQTSIASDVIGASQSGSFTDTMTVVTTENGQVTTTPIARSGIWVLEGATVTFTFFDNGLSTAASFDGTTLTVSASGKTYVYRR